MKVILPFPPSTNNLFINRKGGRHKSTEYDIWLINAGSIMRHQRPTPEVGQLTIDIALRNPNNVRRDADNRIKAVLDLLVKHGVIPADDHRYVRSVTARWVDTGEPCTVTIEPVRDQEAAFQRMVAAGGFDGLTAKGAKP